MFQDPNISLEIIKNNLDKDWSRGECIFQSEMDNVREKYIRSRFHDWFKRSELKAELMANVWHPRNFEKFKYLDPETFGEEF